MNEMTPADVVALTRDNGILGGTGLSSIIILFFIFAMFGGGNFYNGNGVLNRAEMNDGFNTAEIKGNQRDLVKGQFDMQKEVMQNRYDTALGNANLGQQIAENRYSAALQAQNAQSQLATCCCDLKTAIHAEGEATRAMINQQTIDDLKYQLTQAQTAVANAVQTNNILGSLGRFYPNPPVNPFAVYGNYSNGCGC